MVKIFALAIFAVQEKERKQLFTGNMKAISFAQIMLKIKMLLSRERSTRNGLTPPLMLLLLSKREA
jgi:hypothetical protein